MTVLDTVSITPPGGEPVVIGSLQQKMLLTLLVAYGDLSVSVDRIAEELWGDNPPRRWLASIRTLTNVLRRSVPDRDFICWTGRGYRLHRDTSRVQSDVQEMLRVTDQARTALAAGCYDDAVTAARRALVLYGNGPWITDYWHWADLAAECYHVLGRALLGSHRYLNCLVELGQVPEDIEWHEGVRDCVEFARATVAAPAMAV